MRSAVLRAGCSFSPKAAQQREESAALEAGGFAPFTSV
jgi:hypothetical protein